MEKIFILKPEYILKNSTSSKINFNNFHKTDEKNEKKYEFRGTRILDYKNTSYFKDMFIWYKTFFIKEVYENKNHAGSVLFIFYDNSYLDISYGSGIRIVGSSIGMIVS